MLINSFWKSLREISQYFFLSRLSRLRCVKYHWTSEWAICLCCEKHGADWSPFCYFLSSYRRWFFSLGDLPSSIYGFLLLWWNLTLHSFSFVPDLEFYFSTSRLTWCFSALFLFCWYFVLLVLRFQPYMWMMEIFNLRT